MVRTPTYQTRSRRGSRRVDRALQLSAPFVASLQAVGGPRVTNLQVRVIALQPLGPVASPYGAECWRRCRDQAAVGRGFACGRPRHDARVHQMSHPSGIVGAWDDTTDNDEQRRNASDRRHEHDHAGHRRAGRTTTVPTTWTRQCGWRLTVGLDQPGISISSGCNGRGLGPSRRFSANSCGAWGRCGHTAMPHQICCTSSPGSVPDDTAT